jgi:hypothetical protein
LATGAAGKLPVDILNHLVGALESYIRINQGNGNGHALLKKNLVARVNNIVSNLHAYELGSDKLLCRLLKRTNVDISATVQESVEDRRLRWTTYANLKLWFDSWGRDLIELGFATGGENGKCIISEEQLSRIINLDESCLSLKPARRYQSRASPTLSSEEATQLGKPCLHISNSQHRHRLQNDKGSEMM